MLTFDAGISNRRSFEKAQSLGAVQVTMHSVLLDVYEELPNHCIYHNKYRNTIEFIMKHNKDSQTSQINKPETATTAKKKEMEPR